MLAPRGAVNMLWNNNITGGQNPAFSQEIPSRLRDNLFVPLNVAVHVQYVAHTRVSS